jgi:hypothetical protein
LDIAASSDLSNVEDDDWVVVLDEFRLWQIYGRIVASGGTISWFKDWDIAFDDIGANDIARRLAMIPPVPMMPTHAVRFLDVGESVDIDFDWSESYAPAPGQAVTTWDSDGEDGGAGWTDNVENPVAKTYSNISGLTGYRTVLEVDDGNGNAVTLPYRRGVRYVFTLRRPGEAQAGDPWNAEPLTSFSSTPVSGSYDQGYYRTQITVFEDEADQYTIIPGALVILFTEDTYQGYDVYQSSYGLHSGSVGPEQGRENIHYVGRIIDGSIRKDPETGEVTFDAISFCEEASRDLNYPIVINDNAASSIVINDNAASSEWIDTPDLDIDVATRYYTAWHTTLTTIANYYQTGSEKSIKAMDFLEGDIYSTLDTFLQRRIFGRLLCDRIGRFHAEVNVQMQAFGTVPTLWTLEDGDWIDDISITHRTEPVANYVELAGVAYVAGKATPYRSGAPGAYNKYHGSPSSETYLAIDDQDELNTLSGRLLAYKNVVYVARIALAGYWPIPDIAPQEAIYIDNMDVIQGTLDGRFIIREVSHEPNDAGCKFTTIVVEQETDGPAGVTIPIPAELPAIPRRPTRRPSSPSSPPSGGGGAGAEDLGRRIVPTDVGVFVTDNIGANPPVWYGANAGLVTADDLQVWSIRRDPFHWWTSGGTETTLWAATQSGIWKHELFPNGTWVQILTVSDFNTFYAAKTIASLRFARMDFSIESEGQFAVAFFDPVGFGNNCQFCFEIEAEALQTAGAICSNYNYVDHWPDVKWAQHSAGLIMYWSVPFYDPFVNTRLYKTLNKGGAWALIENNARGRPTSISVPYDSAVATDQYVYWGFTSYWRRSVNAGATFADFGPADGEIIGTGGHHDRVVILDDIPQWSNDGGVTWNVLPAHATVTGEGLVEWEGDQLRNVLMCDFGLGATSLAYWQQGYAAWVDKLGNLVTDFGVVEIYGVERDTMGAA